MRTKVAVVFATGKAQNVESALQGRNIGAMEIGHAQVEGCGRPAYTKRLQGRSNRGYRRHDRQQGHCRAWKVLTACSVVAPKYLSVTSAASIV